MATKLSPTTTHIIAVLIIGLVIGYALGAITSPFGREAVTVTTTVTKTVTETKTVTGQPAVAKPGKQVRVLVLFDVGGRGDLSFNDMAWLGAERAHRELGVEVKFATPRSTAEMASLLDRLSSEGKYDLIVLVGFLWTAALEEVAPKHPEQKYALIDAATSKVYSNVACYVFREQEVAALVGVIAADIAHNLGGDKVGSVAGMDIPPLWRFHIGYLFGAKYYEKVTGRKTDLLWIYTGTFTDPAKGKEAAEALIRQGAKVLYGLAGATHLGMFEAVREAWQRGVKVLAIGQDASQEWIDPHHIIISGLKRVDNAVYTAIKEVVEGTFKGGIHSLGLKEGGLGLADLDMVKWFAEQAASVGKLPKGLTPEKVVEIVKELREKYISEEAWKIVKELEQKIISGEIKFKNPSTHDEYTQIIEQLEKGNLEAALVAS